MLSIGRCPECGKLRFLTRKLERPTGSKVCGKCYDNFCCTAPKFQDVPIKIVVKETPQRIIKLRAKGSDELPKTE